MRNLIFTAYADIHNANTGQNITNNLGRVAIYYKNIVVALVSAKINNPDCDVALVTNKELPHEYDRILATNGILIINCPFDSFRFRMDYPWHLAFYKLCAYQSVLSLDYENFLLIDADVYVQNSISMLWNWTPDYLVILDTNETTQRWQNEMHDFFGNGTFIPHWGGEFLGASKAILSIFIGKCKQVFEEMVQRNFNTIHGDEFIESVAIHSLRIPIKDAGMFTYRFWTRTDRRVQTALYKGGISILHVPAEKEYGMLKIYKYIKKKGRIPSQRLAQKMLHILSPSLDVKVKRCLLKTKHWFKQ